MAAKRVVIPGHLFDRMLGHCWEDYPHEACGIMTGRGETVLRAFALRNIHRHPTNRYEIDAADQYAAMRDVLRGREDLVAIYHSHPTTAAYPSQTDVKMSRYPEACYVIVSLLRNPPDVRGFRLADGRIFPMTVERGDDRHPGEWIDLRDGMPGE